MNDKLKGIWQKVCAGAAVTGDYAVRTAGNVGEAAQSVFNSSKISVKMLDVKSDIEILYKEIGKIIYAAHSNEEPAQEELEAMLSVLDDKFAELAELEESLRNASLRKKCEACGKSNPRGNEFCASCGEKL